MKLQAFFAYSIVYFVLIWISRRLGSGILRAGLLVWAWPISQEELVVPRGGWSRRAWNCSSNLERRAEEGTNREHSGAIQTEQRMADLVDLLLWIGWFGFNPGSVLHSTLGMTCRPTTFLAAAPPSLHNVLPLCMIKKMPDLIYATNGVLMGLIIITPLAGFVSPGSAVILGLIGGPLFLAGRSGFEIQMVLRPGRLFPGHLLGGLSGF